MISSPVWGKLFQEIDMPILFEQAGHEDVECSLVDESGELTIEGQIIDEFLGQIDYDDLFEDEDLQEFINEDETFFARDTDSGLEECSEGDEDAEEFVVESLSGEVVAEMIDEDDLLGMFEHWVGELPDDSLSERTVKEAATDLLTEFTKGSFRKLRRSGPKGPALVNRMLGAMLAKGVIKRAKAKGPAKLAKSKPRSKGGSGGIQNVYGPAGAKGYRGGSYDKFASGYGAGARSHLPKYRTYVGSHKSQLRRAKAKTVGAKTGASTRVKMTSIRMKAKPKAGASKQSALNRVKAKGFAGKKGTKARSKVNASVDYGDNHGQMTESTRGSLLAAAVVGHKEKAAQKN